jgi:hypothetical protein
MFIIPLIKFIGLNSYYKTAEFDNFKEVFY